MIDRSLRRSSSPVLGNLAVDQRGAMACPHSALATVGGDDWHHEDVPFQYDGPSYGALKQRNST